MDTRDLLPGTSVIALDSHENPTTGGDLAFLADDVRKLTRLAFLVTHGIMFNRDVGTFDEDGDTQLLQEVMFAAQGYAQQLAYAR